MRPLEWLFPIVGYIRRPRLVTARRAALTAIVAILVQWVSVNVMLVVGTTIPASVSEKIVLGLKTAALGGYRGGWRFDSEWGVMMLLFGGGILIAAGIEMLWGLLLIRRRVPKGVRGAKRKLLKFVLLGMQTWAIYWAWVALWPPFMESTFAAVGYDFAVPFASDVFRHMFEIVIFLISVPPAALIVVTTLQAAKATVLICGIQAAAGATEPAVAGGRPLAWKRHLCIFFASAAGIAALLLLSVPVFRPRTPPASWPPERRVAALLKELDAPPSWVERTFNIFPYRREYNEIVSDLVAVGPPAVEPLIAALENEPATRDFRGTRQSAASILGQLGDKRAVEPLTRVLTGNGDRYVRSPAAWALGRLGDPAAIEPLATVLKKDSDDWMRAAAAAALGDLGGGRAIECLQGALQDPNPQVRETATYALQQLGLNPRPMPTTNPSP